MDMTTLSSTMDMSMTMTTSSTSATATSSMSMTSMDMEMVPYLHFTGGDNLFFKTLMPSSHGAIAGACIVLVAIAIFQRWVSGTRAILNAYWRRRALAMMVPTASPMTTDSQEKMNKDIEEVNIDSLPKQYTNSSMSYVRSSRTMMPFILAHDIPRGVLYAFQAFLAYVLMLAVMTFQAAYIISIIVGLGIGEVFFGRMGGGEDHVLH